jgi:glycosyltransferase involved in cell wall biosynthesis
MNGRNVALSIAVVNHNYAHYLPVSVASALVQGDHEVIVVDDGSTDNSRVVILGFGDRVKPVFKANGGHSSAVNAAFAAATGDIIVFLDADDVMLPGCASLVLGAWSSKVSKVQWGSYTITFDGTRTGHVYPRFTDRCTPEWCRTQMSRCSWYAAPMTSGNAWSRKFLSNVMPLPERVGSPGWALDDYLHLLATSATL